MRDPRPRASVLEGLRIALSTASDCAKAYAKATTERSAAYEPATLCSDLAYRDAKASVRIARMIQDAENLPAHITTIGLL